MHMLVYNKHLLFNMHGVNIKVKQNKHNCEDDKIKSDIVVRTYDSYGRDKICIQSLGRKSGRIESAWKIMRSQNDKIISVCVCVCVCVCV